jgi:hypothetical protein
VPTPTPHNTPVPGATPAGGKKLGRITVGQSVGKYALPDGTTVPVATAETPFGGTVEAPDTLRGTLYFIPENPVTLDLDHKKAEGVLFAKTLNIAPRDFREGFPGLPNRIEWFALRYDGTFAVAKEGDYQVRLVSDDGSWLWIDDMQILDNGGAHPPQEKKSPVHLVAGLHKIRVEYFQGPRYSIALQLFVTAPGEAEKLFTTNF